MFGHSTSVANRSLRRYPFVSGTVGEKFEVFVSAMDATCVGVDAYPVFVMFCVMRLSSGLESLLQDAKHGAGILAHKVSHRLNKGRVNSISILTSGYEERGSVCEPGKVSHAVVCTHRAMTDGELYLLAFLLICVSGRDDCRDPLICCLCSEDSLWHRYLLNISTLFVIRRPLFAVFKKICGINYHRKFGIFAKGFVKMSLSCN